MDPIVSLEEASAALGRAGAALDVGDQKQAADELQRAGKAFGKVAAGMADANTVIRLHACLLAQMLTALHKVLRRGPVGGTPVS